MKFRKIQIENYNFQNLDEYQVKGLRFDSSSKGLYGGSGKTFNWSLLKNFSNEIPFILSGEFAGTEKGFLICG